MGEATKHSAKEGKKQIWGGHLAAPPDDEFVQFCAGRDVSAIPMADQTLVPYDVLTNLAHLAGLEKIGAVSAAEASAMRQGLIKIKALNDSGEFPLSPEKEDVHCNIEHFLTDTLGIVAAKKIHTARSRNDQVTTDMRLYIRDEALDNGLDLLALIDAIAGFAEKHLRTYSPGFTHGQPAMPTTMAHWALSWGYAVLRDAEALLAEIQLINNCPLGAAASFGSSWNPDREYTARLLGFPAPQENTLDAITNKSEPEMRVAGAIAHATTHFCTISQDLYWLSHPYFNIVRLPDKFVSGSSIMPHKRNPDFAEIIRAKASLCQSYTASIWGLSKSSISGYNRDAQPSKYLIMDIFREIRPVPRIIAEVVSGCQVNTESASAKASADFVYSADFADFIARKYGLSFRDAYNATAAIVRCSKDGRFTTESVSAGFAEALPDKAPDAELLALSENPHLLVDQKVHTGGPAPQTVEASISKLRQKVASRREDYGRLTEHIGRCFSLLLKSTPS